MKKLTKEEEEILKAFMKENNLTSNSILYRYTSKDYLIESNGNFYIEAKTEPTDMVVDRYHGFWEVFIASEVGQGISFLSEKEREYFMLGIAVGMLWSTEFSNQINKKADVSTKLTLHVRELDLIRRISSRRFLCFLRAY